MPVLFDKPGRHSGQLAGRSPYLQPVHAELPADRLGDIVPVRVTAALANSLAGEIIPGTAIGAAA
jgi:tRNA-2-methylthio-N6-dimethylallyladenosine synthase